MRLLREFSRRKLRTDLTIIGNTIGIWALVVFSSMANKINSLVGLGDGRVLPRAAVFIRPVNVPHADGLLAGLGCELDAEGFPLVDATGRCSAPGVWAAGNVVDPRLQVIAAAGAGSVAAIAINADLVREDVERALKAGSQPPAQELYRGLSDMNGVNSCGSGPVSFERSSAFGSPRSSPSTVARLEDLRRDLAHVRTVLEQRLGAREPLDHDGLRLVLVEVDRVLQRTALLRSDDVHGLRRQSLVLRHLAGMEPEASDPDEFTQESGLPSDPMLEPVSDHDGIRAGDGGPRAAGGWGHPSSAGRAGAPRVTREGRGRGSVHDKAYPRPRPDPRGRLRRRGGAAGRPRSPSPQLLRSDAASGSSGVRSSFRRSRPGRRARPDAGRYSFPVIRVP